MGTVLMLLPPPPPPCLQDMLRSPLQGSTSLSHNFGKSKISVRSLFTEMVSSRIKSSRADSRDNGYQPVKILYNLVAMKA
jgi:hypothetical protein